MSIDIHKTIHIRPLKAEELPALEWDGAFTHFRRQFALTYRDYRAGNGIPWVAVDRTNGDILGQVFVLFNSRFRKELADGNARAYLYSIRVKEHVRNLGLGRYMMAFVEEDLVDRGFKSGILNVARDNQAGYRFYYRLGYRIVAPEEGQWSYLDHQGIRRFVNEPAWRLEKSLESRS